MEKRLGRTMVLGEELRIEQLLWRGAEVDQSMSLGVVKPLAGGS